LIKCIASASHEARHRAKVVHSQLRVSQASLSNDYAGLSIISARSLRALAGHKAQVSLASTFVPVIDDTNIAGAEHEACHRTKLAHSQLRMGPVSYRMYICFLTFLSNMILSSAVSSVCIGAASIPDLIRRACNDIATRCCSPAARPVVELQFSARRTLIVQCCACLQIAKRQAVLLLRWMATINLAVISVCILQVRTAVFHA